MKPNIHPQLQNFLQDLILPHASFYYRVGNNMFKINNRNTRTRCEICLKLTIKTPERRAGKCLLGSGARSFGNCIIT